MNIGGVGGVGGVKAAGELPEVAEVPPVPVQSTNVNRDSVYTVHRPVYSELSLVNVHTVVQPTATSQNVPFSGCFLQLLLGQAIVDVLHEHLLANTHRFFFCEI